MLLVSDNRHAGHLPGIIGHERVLMCSLAEASPGLDDIVVIDVDLEDAQTRKTALSLFQKTHPRRALAVAIDPDCQAAHQAARKLGATILLSRPLTAGILHRFLEGLEKAQGPAQMQAAAALADAHCAFCNGQALDLGALRLAAADIADAVADDGIRAWLVEVGKTRDGCFRHALGFAGTAAGFGRQLGMNDKDLVLLTVAALVADLGMAGLPQSLIDKQDPLEREEIALINHHPLAAYDYLKVHADLPPMVLDAVRHHHELGDGSGYPDGLAGTAISDLAHVLAVCDLFAELAYSCGKGSVPDPAEALAVLDVMARERKLAPGPVAVLAAALGGAIGWKQSAALCRA